MTDVARPFIVLVEDDLRLAQLVARYLESDGFRVASIHRGNEVVDRVLSDPPDLLILDLGLPGEDGLAICRRLRPGFTRPILMLTARAGDVDQVLGLEFGADDYVVKPVEPRVLTARIRALLRRSQPELGASTVAPDTTPTLSFGELVIATASRSVSLNGVDVMLSGGEFDLLLYLASRAGTIQSRETLFRTLYHREYDGLGRALDNRISRLRRKLGDDADDPRRIKTIWGQGYLFVPDAW